MLIDNNTSTVGCTTFYSDKKHSLLVITTSIRSEYSTHRTISELFTTIYQFILAVVSLLLKSKGALYEKSFHVSNFFQCLKKRQF